jgi:hypothetical protein
MSVNTLTNSSIHQEHVSLLMARRVDSDHVNQITTYREKAVHKCLAEKLLHSTFVEFEHHSSYRLGSGDSGLNQLLRLGIFRTEIGPETSPQSLISAREIVSGLQWTSRPGSRGLNDTSTTNTFSSIAISHLMEASTLSPMKDCRLDGATGSPLPLSYLPGNST